MILSVRVLIQSSEPFISWCVNIILTTVFILISPASADAKKVLDSHQTVTLNEAICAIFYLNISHNVKQHERKKDRKQAIKKEVKERKARAKARASEGGDADDANDSEDDGNGEEDSGEEKSTPLKPAKKSTEKQGNTKGLKRQAQEDSDDDDDDENDDQDDQDDEEEVAPPKKKSMKKVQNHATLITFW